MNLVDCTVLEVLEKVEVKASDVSWLTYDLVIYKVIAVTCGHRFMTDIHIPKGNDRGQIKEGYKFIQ